MADHPRDDGNPAVAVAVTLGAVLVLVVALPVGCLGIIASGKDLEAIAKGLLDGAPTQHLNDC